jgi:hypothetical protein
MMMAKLCVPAGGSVHVKTGDASLPSQEKSDGIDPPFANAGLEISNDIATSFVDCVSADGGICTGFAFVDEHAARLMARK